MFTVVPGEHTRREFIKRGALAVAAVSVPMGMAGLSGEARAANRKPYEKSYDVAVLTPGSGTFPALGSNLFSGLKLFAEGTGSFRLSRRNFRGNEGAAIEAAKQAAESGANLVVGFLSPEVAGAVRREVGNIILVNLHSGANVPREDADPLENTLSCWQSSYSAGRWAARNIGGRAVEVMSCYDSGYDAPCAFRAGFEEAGGEISETFVTHMPSEVSPGLDAALGGVKAAKPDFVYASYFGNLASDFLEAYAATGLKKTIPLVGSPFLTDEGIVKTIGGAAVGVTSFGTWTSGSGIKANRKFVSGYVARYGRVPDGLAMLGYETAGIVGAALKSTSGRTSRMREALQTVSFDGPRGEARLGSGGSHVYARKVKKTDGRYVNVAVGGFEERVAGVDRVSGITENPKTGWLDNYLVL